MKITFISNIDNSSNQLLNPIPAIQSLPEWYKKKKPLKGIIPAGTPIFQLHPFKRESWKMELGESDQKEIFENQIKLKHKFTGEYKSQWWRRKEYR